MDEARSDRMDKILFKECLRSVKAQVSSFGPRDRQLLDQIVGPGGTQQGYLSGGFVVSVGIRAALHAVDRSVYDFHRILDFGCGSARVLLWFQGSGSKANLFGCDINPKAIEWCKAHARFGEFLANEAWPPLRYSDQMFDLIYAISVVTHLNEQMQLAWLLELRRIVEPGGIIMMSVHGEDKATNDLKGEELEEFQRSGFFYKTVSEGDKSSIEGLPDFYQVAFHSEQFLQTWGQFFDVLAYFKNGCTAWAGFGRSTRTFEGPSQCGTTTLQISHLCNPSDCDTGSPSRWRSTERRFSQGMGMGFLSRPQAGTVGSKTGWTETWRVQQLH